MLEGLNVLITGGTGSFGKAFIKKALKQRAKKVVIYSRDELKQEQMRQTGFPDTSIDPDSRLRYFLGDVRDPGRLRIALHDIDIVIHAAALKQVPAIEYNPYEGVNTNIIGSQNVLEAAITCRVKKLVALSTDKAVNPINAYGASKLMAEKLFIQGNAYASGTSTRISVVRYGNVVGSRGSVVPKFKEQKKKGLLTITDVKMTRFWITLDQATDFVLEALDTMVGGEIFVPKIPSCNIMQLAQTIGPDCNIEVSGIRPGEKLHEVLIAEGETAISQENRYVVLPSHTWFERGSIEGKPFKGSYASDKNELFLTGDQIGSLIK